MSELEQFALLAEYNQLMNKRQYAAAEKLTIIELWEDKGAFFKSVLGTLNHILVGDIIWLKRFSEQPSSYEALIYVAELERPKSLNAILFEDFSDLKEARKKIDEIIVEWIKRLSNDDINECISYSNMAGKLFSKPYVSLINHFFVHQVHHRGQVTTLLSQYGLDFGETDLIEIIHECEV